MVPSTTLEALPPASAAISVLLIARGRGRERGRGRGVSITQAALVDSVAPTQGQDNEHAVIC